MSFIFNTCFDDTSSSSIWYQNLCSFPQTASSSMNENEDNRDEVEQIRKFGYNCEMEGDNNSSKKIDVRDGQEFSNNVAHYQIEENNPILSSETKVKSLNEKKSSKAVSMRKNHAKESEYDEGESESIGVNAATAVETSSSKKEIRKKRRGTTSMKKQKSKIEEDDDSDSENEAETAHSANTSMRKSGSTMQQDEDNQSITGYSVISECSLRSLHSALNKYGIPDDSLHIVKSDNVIFGYITNTYSYKKTFEYMLSASLLRGPKRDDDENSDEEGEEEYFEQHQGSLLLQSSSAITAEKKKKKLMEIKDSKEALALTASCMGRNHRLVADRLIVIGDQYHSLRDFDLALKSYLEALNIFSVKIGDDQPESISTRMKIGCMQLLRHEYEDSLEAYSHALYMKNALGSNDVITAQIHEVLSYVHYKKLENSEALKDLKRALRTYRELYGDDDNKVIQTVVNIGTLYVASGDTKKAMTIYREAIKLKIGLVGKTHQDVADILIKWGLCCTKIGDTKMAMKILKRAYSMYVEKLGDTHLSSINALSHIGNTYLLDGQDEKALKAHSRAIRICKKMDQHHYTTYRRSQYYITTANALVNLGLLWMTKVDSDKTIRCLNEALNIYKKTFSNTHFSVSDTLFHLGTIHQLTDKNDKALKYFTKVLQLRKAAYSGNGNAAQLVPLGHATQNNQQHLQHLEVADTLRKIASVQSQLKDYLSSLNNYAKTLDIYCQTTTSNSNSNGNLQQHNIQQHTSQNATGSSEKSKIFADILVEASSLLDKLGESSKARNGYQEALRIYKCNKLEFEHPSVTMTMELMKQANNNSQSKNQELAISKSMLESKNYVLAIKKIQHHFGTN